MARWSKEIKKQLPIGQRFGLWVVVADAGSDHRGRIAAVKCDCGTEKTLRIYPLLYGRSVSCGCLRAAFNVSRSVHGQSGSMTWASWRAMRERCSSVKHKNFADYGGRGIAVCSRWSEFSNFLADMGERPSRGHTIDRIDVNGNYEPSNCRWSTRSEQMRNTRTNRRIEFRGENLTLAEWSKRLGLNHHAVSYRLKHWPVERALTEPGDSGRRYR